MTTIRIACVASGEALEKKMLGRRVETQEQRNEEKSLKDG